MCVSAWKQLYHTLWFIADVCYFDTKCIRCHVFCIVWHHLYLLVCLFWLRKQLNEYIGSLDVLQLVKHYSVKCLLYLIYLNAKFPYFHLESVTAYHQIDLRKNDIWFVACHYCPIFVNARISNLTFIQMQRSCSKWVL